MKTILFLIFFCIITNAFAQDKILKFLDLNFKKSLIADSVDLNKNGEIEISEAKQITCLNLNSACIANLDGIEEFTSLKILNCNSNYLKDLDLSKNLALTKLDCSNNSLQSLNVKQNIELVELLCYRNNIKILEISNNTYLRVLDCSRNEINYLDIRNNIELTKLNFKHNNLSRYNVYGNQGNFSKTLDYTIRFLIYLAIPSKYYRYDTLHIR